MFLLCTITDESHLPYHKRYSHLFRYLMCSQCYQKTSFSYFCIICQNFAFFSKCYFVFVRPIFSVKSRGTVIEIVISNTTKVYIFKVQLPFSFFLSFFFSFFLFFLSFFLYLFIYFAVIILHNSCTTWHIQAYFLQILVPKIYYEVLI